MHRVIETFFPSFEDFAPSFSIVTLGRLFCYIVTMARQTHSLLSRFEVLAAAAVIAAHASAPEQKIRQRDVRFLVELFSNWVEHSLGSSVLELQNTQIQRYLNSLVDDGLCQKLSRGRVPYYRLRRVAIIELVGRLTTLHRHIQPELSLFACYFIFNYRARLWKLVESEGKQFPIALRIELEALLDYPALLQRLIAQAEIELRKLEVRIADAHIASGLAQRLSKDGMQLADIAKQIEREHPYQLNSAKPLSSLIASIPVADGEWELLFGSERRASDLWEPSKILLESYLTALKSLLAKNS